MLDGKSQKIALSLEFSHQDQLHSFVQQLKTKIKREKNTDYLSPLPVAVVGQEDANIEALTSSVAATVSAKPKSGISITTLSSYTSGITIRKF